MNPFLKWWKLNMRSWIWWTFVLNLIIVLANLVVSLVGVFHQWETQTSTSISFTTSTRYDPQNITVCTDQFTSNASLSVIVVSADAFGSQSAGDPHPITSIVSLTPQICFFVGPHFLPNLPWDSIFEGGVVESYFTLTATYIAPPPMSFAGVKTAEDAMDYLSIPKGLGLERPSLCNSPYKQGNDWHLPSQKLLHLQQLRMEQSSPRLPSPTPSLLMAVTVWQMEMTLGSVYIGLVDRWKLSPLYHPSTLILCLPQWCLVLHFLQV
jgi:hypothetical protein